MANATVRVLYVGAFLTLSCVFVAVSGCGDAVVHRDPPPPMNEADMSSGDTDEGED